MKVVIFSFWTVIVTVMLMLMTTTTTTLAALKLQTLSVSSAPSSFVGTFGKYFQGAPRVTNFNERLNKLCQLVEVEEEVNRRSPRKAHYCEATFVDLNCPFGSVVRVKSAVFKPISGTKCNRAVYDPDFDAAACPTEEVFADKRLQSICDDQKRCYLSTECLADELMSVDGSRLYYCHYLDLQYTCQSQDPTPGKAQEAYGCDGHWLSLQCPAGKVISITMATKVKATADSPDLRCNHGNLIYADGPCDRNFTAAVTHHCEGNAQCEMLVHNDTIPGLNEGTCGNGYLKVEYTCKTSDACARPAFQHQTVNPGYSGMGYFNVLNWIDILIKMVQ